MLRNNSTQHNTKSWNALWRSNYLFLINQVLSSCYSSVVFERYFTMNIIMILLFCCCLLKICYYEHYYVICARYAAVVLMLLLLCCDDCNDRGRRGMIIFCCLQSSSAFYYSYWFRKWNWHLILMVWWFMHVTIGRYRKQY